VAVNCCVAPVTIDVLVGVTAIDTSVAGVTVSVTATEKGELDSVDPLMITWPE